MMLAAGSLGYLLSVFIATWGAIRWGAAFAFWLCSAGALAGALVGSLALGDYREEVHRPVQHNATATSHTRSITALLLLIGYTAHYWELLGSWTWTPSRIVETLHVWHLDPISAGLIVALAVHLRACFQHS